MSRSNETPLTDGEIVEIANELAHAALYEVTSDGKYTIEDHYAFRQTVHHSRNVVADIVGLHGWFSDKAFSERWITIWQSRSIISHFE